jgi:hypothetical protein
MFFGSCCVAENNGFWMLWKAVAILGLILFNGPVWTLDLQEKVSSPKLKLDQGSL